MTLMLQPNDYAYYGGGREDQQPEKQSMEKVVIRDIDEVDKIFIFPQISGLNLLWVI